jgi:starch-binding outer membrane protein, SusD/RagB family
MKTNSRTLIGAALMLASFAVAGCKDILSVHVPGRVSADALNDPALAATMAASVVADVECAWDNYVAGSALIGDEFIQASGNLNQRNWASRRITADEPTMAQGSCSTAYGIYTPLQTARFQAEDIFNRLQTFTDAQVPNRTLLEATVRAYGAFSLVALGEGFCQMAIDGGPLMTPQQVLQLAEQWFTEAISLAQQAKSTDIQNMALAGRARVRIDLQNFTGALADAKQVPVGYVKLATRDNSDPRRYDALCQNITCASGKNATIAPNYRNVTWQGVADPRVAVTTTGLLAFDNAQIWYYPTNKHTTVAYGLLLASYKEARLYIAEASARTGDLATARQLINQMHTEANIPAFDPGGAASQDSVTAQVIEERRRELFTEGGHRLNDQLRFRGTKWNIPFKGEAGSIFPTGVDATGLPYGTTTCFPLPTVEVIGNPNISHP